MGDERKSPSHWHSCPGCGARWFCVRNCLATCHCIGKPRCTHWYCAMCAGRSEVGDHFELPAFTAEVSDG